MNLLVHAERISRLLRLDDPWLEHPPLQSIIDATDSVLVDEVALFLELLMFVLVPLFVFLCRSLKRFLLLLGELVPDFSEARVGRIGIHLRKAQLSRGEVLRLDEGQVWRRGLLRPPRAEDGANLERLLRLVLNRLHGVGLVVVLLTEVGQL